MLCVYSVVMVIPDAEIFKTFERPQDLVTVAEALATEYQAIKEALEVEQEPGELKKLEKKKNLISRLATEVSIL